MNTLLLTEAGWASISAMFVALIGAVVSIMTLMKQTKMSKQIDGQRTELLKAVAEGAAARMSKNVVETIKADPDISLTNKE